MDKTQLEISWASLWRVFVMLLFTVAFFLVQHVLMVLFLSIIISSALDSPVSYLERKKIPRIISTIAVFLAVFVALAFVLYALIPVSVIELRDFLNNLSTLNMPVFGSFDASQFALKLDKELGNFTEILLSGSMSFFNLIAVIFGNVLLIVTTIVLSLYLTINRGGVEKFLRAILPVTYEDQAIGVYHRVRHKLGLWLQGQLLLMFTVGLVVFFGLLFLGVKYSLVLAILAGLLEIVPVVGPIFAGTLAFLVALSQSFSLAVWAVIFFVVVHQLENHVLVPVVMQKAIGMNPVVVVVALLAGSEIAGLTGVILAVPAAVVFAELLEDWEARKVRVRGRRLQFEE